MRRLLIEAAERRWLPDPTLRWGIRRLLRERLTTERQQLVALHRSCQGESTPSPLEQSLQHSPIAVHTEEANEQHYEVPAEFFQQVLGRRLKYSCGLWPDAATDLDRSESAMLALTTERARIQDGMRILELGCGWGSLTLWLAEHFPACSITGVSNSSSQRAYIEAECQRRGLNNVRILTADVNQLEIPDIFDRVVSVEMFEHVRNHAALLQRISQWLTPDGELFVHIFCHRELSYLFETEGESNWMGRHFFTGGMMPAFNWFRNFPEHLRVVEDWQVDGTHYAKTSEAWLAKLDRNRDAISALFAAQQPKRDPQRTLQRWRMFFLACAELFGYQNGREWFVGHYRFTQATAEKARDD